MCGVRVARMQNRKSGGDHSWFVFESLSLFLVAMIFVFFAIRVQCFISTRMG